MKQRFLRWAIVPVVAIAAYVGFSSFIEESEDLSGGSCDLCVVKEGPQEKVIYSCKKIANKTCSYLGKVDSGIVLGKVDVSVSCNNALACYN